MKKLDLKKLNPKNLSRRQRIVVIIVAAVLILALVGFLCVHHYVSKINRVGEEIETVAPEDESFETDENNGLDELDADAIDWDSMESGPLGDEKLLNILLVGQDRRPGEGRARSDAMIVCSVNVEKKKVSMISFLRDLYVQIPGYTDNRLNTAYVFGGFPLLKKTLTKNFGITIDGCFEVDFSGFKALIDKIGGVDIKLTASEAGIVGGGCTEGVNRLNGTQALEYARIRKIGTDFARTSRQRTVLMAAFQRVKELGLTELIGLLDAALPYLSTDMSAGNIYSTVRKLFPLISSVDVNSYYIPADGTYSNVYIRQMAVLLPDLNKIRDLLKNEYLPF